MYQVGTEENVCFQPSIFTLKLLCTCLYFFSSMCKLSKIGCCGFLVNTNCCLLVQISSFYFLRLDRINENYIYLCPVPFPLKLQLNSNSRLCLLLCFVSGTGIRWTFYVTGLLIDHLSSFLLATTVAGQQWSGHPISCQQHVLYSFQSHHY